MSAEPATVPCAATVAVVATPVPAAAPPAAAVSTDDLKEANTTLSAKSAIEIFVAKHSHTSRDALSCKLAGDYGITSKSVRGMRPGVCLSVHALVCNLSLGVKSL